MIILDAEVMFATDIGELWQLFRLFSDNQVGPCGKFVRTVQLSTWYISLDISEVA